MKKFYLLLFLLVSGFGFAQVNLKGDARYHAEITASMGDATGDGCCCGGLGYLYLNGIGSTNSLKNRDDYWENRTEIITREYTEANLATDITLYSRRRTRSGGCRVTQQRDASVLVERNQDITYTNWENGGLFAHNVYGSLRVLTYPIIDLSNPVAMNNIIGTDSSIKIDPIIGVLPEYFDWMYHIEGEGYHIRRLSGQLIWIDTWRSLPGAYQGINSLNIKCNNFLPIEAVGKKIKLRANNNGVSVELLYAKSAPHIDLVVPIKTKCFDTGDGRAVIKFSSKLAVGETLSCSVLSYDEKTGEEQDVFYSTQKGQSIVIGDDLTYEIPYDFPKGKYLVSLSGWYKEPNKSGANTYVMDPKHQMEFKVSSPTAVDFSITKKDINCFGGSDGAIDIIATGGIENGIYQYSKDEGNTWITFTHGDKATIEGLSLGICRVNVRKLKDSKDTVGCIAMKSDDIKTLSKVIGQPGRALELVAITPLHPTFNKAEDGKIVALITGGTLIKGNSYSYQWKNSKNEIIGTNKSITQFSNNIFTISLHNVPADTYSLLVTDKKNCLLDPKVLPALVVVLNDPEPIEIKLEVLQVISCNTENLDPTGNAGKASDGVIKATVKGGITLEGAVNGGQPYFFYWKKEKEDGTWEDLDNIKGPIASGLAKGNYSLNVLDANGIVQGTYNTKDLVKAIPTLQTIAEPAKLELTFDSTNVSCYQGNNGWATANIAKGKAPYTYKWYGVNEGIINDNKISKLTKGEYFIEVTDAKGCFIKGSILIDEPTEEVKVDYVEIFTPIFFGATNGRIVAEITGGTPNDNKSYNYEWKNSSGVLQTTTAVFENGIYTITLNNVPADTYFLTITDKNYNKAMNQIANCSILESEVKLTEPDPLNVIFEIKQTISCNTSNEFGDDTDITPKDGHRDESQDGILIAHVTGGTPLASSVNNGLPYYFYWKKQQADGSWLALSDIKGETASNLSHGNYALNIKDRNGIMLGTYVNNKLTQEIDVTQLMQEPPKLSVTITHGNVFCNGGNDGWATANVVGGTPPYDYIWSNEVEIDKNTILKAGTYWVFVTDAKGCTTQETVEIEEPKAPLRIEYIQVLNPSFHKATNGKIVVEVTGGTLYSDNTYWFEWKNSKGILQTSTITNFSNGVYTITLNGLPEEVYSLTVRDANYNVATSKKSCTVVNSIIALDDPDPIEVTFEVVRTISCNVSNEFGNETDANPLDGQRDESQDGILVAHVKGGIQLQVDQNSGLPYFYTWKKQQKDGSWAIWNDLDETAENLSDGIYSLNVEDANGIKLGTYVNNVLVKEIDLIYYMPQPAELKLTLTKLNASCNNGADGWAEAHVSGGTFPYTYEWTNGETTQRIENITTNNYFVIVTDAKGCVVQGSVFVGDPKGIFTTETVKNPTCYKGNDGLIELNVTGGNLPYSYLWNTGATTKDLNNLVAGTYEVAINCPDCCVYKKRFVLKDPEPVIVNVGPDRTLCNDQNLDLDATIADPNAQYSWTATNGFTSNEAKVNVSKSGRYYVKVTSGLGCIGEDEIVIKTSKAVISSEFLLSSQAYLDEEVILVNTSSPFGESTNWVIPKGVQIVEQKEKYITLKFDATGVYSIGLQQTQGDCYATYNKNVTVEQRSTLPSMNAKSQLIVDFVVTPNPSNGNFKAFVTLENDTPINLRLFSSAGQNTMIQKKESGKKKYEIVFENSLVAGMYVLVLETGQQTLVKKIIIY